MGVPLLGYALARLHRAGLRRIAVNAHHLADRLVAEIGAWSTVHLPDLEVRFSVEVPDILGTGGALVAARPLMGEGPMVVVNGDILCDFDVPGLVAAHRERGAAATLLLAEHPEVERFGAVIVDAQGRVADLAGLGARLDAADGGGAGDEAGRGVFSGVHLTEPAIFEHLPAGGKSCVVRQGYVPLMEAGRDVRGVLHRGSWNDLGTPRRYLQTHVDLMDCGYPAGEALELLWEGAPPPGVLPSFAVDADGREHGDRSAVQLSPDARLHAPLALFEGCRVESGAEVGPHAVIGAGATVASRATVRRAVVWPDTGLGPGRTVENVIAFRHKKRNLVVPADS